MTIASTTGLSGAAIAATTFYVTQHPKYTLDNNTYSMNSNITSGDNVVYGTNATISGNVGTSGYEKSDAGWVGITTYMGVEGEMRVKKEVLVAMSGIETGPAGAAGTAGKAFPPAWATDLSV